MTELETAIAALRRTLNRVDSEYDGGDATGDLASISDAFAVVERAYEARVSSNALALLRGIASIAYTPLGMVTNHGDYLNELLHAGLIEMVFDSDDFKPVAYRATESSTQKCSAA